ncbi:hypothetical protein WA026_002087 [Henosepilachna vigintioctopunctata]
MLKIPLFTAEALLRNNEWSRELLLEKWMKDPIECCQLAGVQAPSNVLNHAGSFDSSVSTSDTTEDLNELTCEICLFTVTSTEQPVKMSCKHYFCKACWESYLTIKIQDGDAHHILCPAYQCHILVPVEFIEKLVSPDMARRYLQFDIKAFVESNKSIKWCPIAGCGRAVRLPEAEQLPCRGFSKSIPNTSHAVDCGNSHFFCWECLGESHAPCGCNQWQEWLAKIKEVKPEELKASCSGSEDAANCLWLVTNSKPCPNCKSPIQKNEGCNHIKCSKCKFDFCWVCQESWKRHSSATGGYFRCNRFESVHRADEKQCSLISEALDKNNQLQETSRFLHFYTRFKNHENSQKLEEPLLNTVKQKMEILASSLGLRKGEDTGEKSTKFIEDGVRELLKARRVLCGSYVYGYYLVDDGYNKSIFEFMQNELEEVTEKLSEMIARSYLRTPKAMIIQTTTLARRKRHEFVRAVAQGLVPPETPPNQRKRKRKHLDSDFTQTSVWLKDCEWPEYDSEDENDLAYKHFNTRSSTPKDKDHQCGLLCTHSNCPQSDYNVEMIIALEMSRLQMIEDRLKKANQTNSVTPDPSSSISNNSSESTDDQLRLAIQLSLQESRLNQKNGKGGGSQTNYQRSNADFTVDYFLRSLAHRNIDLKSLELDVDKLKNETSREIFFRPCNGNEDGRFQISDIHENGFAFEDVDDYEDPDIRLKRSHSTGDLRVRRSGRGSRQGTNGEEPIRYHLDSDHSSQHDEKPEELAKKLLTLPSSSKTKHFLLLQQSYPEEDLYQGQSSVEDTTISDSINADMEVCEIFNPNESEEEHEKLYENEVIDNCLKNDNEIINPNESEQEDEKLYGDEVIDNCLNSDNDNKEIKTENVETTQHKKHSHNPFASIKAKFYSSHLPKASYFSRAINKNLELLSEKKISNKAESKDNRRGKKHAGESMSEKHSPKSRKLKKCDNQNSFSKSTGFLADSKRNNCLCSSHTLRIKICKENKRSKPLETDSSNEYESETGIPKSPTLFISGVSISRTPEPKSPGMSLILNGRQSRSSSLSVPMPINSCSLSISSTSLNNTHPEPFTPSLVRSNTPSSSKSHLEFSPKESPKKENPNSRSKSANEPEREREMFRFPKSSTDGALSSVLHVQESNLSSDDFHEALFLLERSPKTRDSKRKKKFKKKDKDEKKEDLSSAL